MIQPNATFENLKEDYFGIYVKLTRGYYEQFTAVDKIPQAVGELLAQHELNIEVADAFVEALRWLLRERCFPRCAPPRMAAAGSASYSMARRCSPAVRVQPCRAGEAATHARTASAADPEAQPGGEKHP